jgi:hypothetical protein
MKADSVHQIFSAARGELVDQIKQDRSMLAAVLCGSLSHEHRLGEVRYRSGPGHD